MFVDPWSNSFLLHLTESEIGFSFTKICCLVKPMNSIVNIRLNSMPMQHTKCFKACLLWLACFLCIRLIRGVKTCLWWFLISRCKVDTLLNFEIRCFGNSLLPRFFIFELRCGIVSNNTTWDTRLSRLAVVLLNNLSSVLRKFIFEFFKFVHQNFLHSWLMIGFYGDIWFSFRSAHRLNSHRCTDWSHLCHCFNESRVACNCFNDLGYLLFNFATVV